MQRQYVFTSIVHEIYICPVAKDVDSIAGKLRRQEPWIGIAFQKRAHTCTGTLWEMNENKTLAMRDESGHQIVLEGCEYIDIWRDFSNSLVRVGTLLKPTLQAA